MHVYTEYIYKKKRHRPIGSRVKQGLIFSLYLRSKLVGVSIYTFGRGYCVCRLFISIFLSLIDIDCRSWSWLCSLFSVFVHVVYSVYTCPWDRSILSILFYLDSLYRLGWVGLGWPAHSPLRRRGNDQKKIPSPVDTGEKALCVVSIYIFVCWFHFVGCRSILPLRKMAQ